MRRKKGSLQKPIKSTTHPCHKKEINRLRRIKGQIEGVEKMILDSRYCPEIIMQIRAACAALKSLESTIMNTHLKHCVLDAARSKDQTKIDQKLSEILKLIKVS
jgi:DNA-binding FrmR family transcriptional regulator